MTTARKNGDRDVCPKPGEPRMQPRRSPARGHTCLSSFFSRRLLPGAPPISQGKHGRTGWVMVAAAAALLLVPLAAQAPDLILQGMQALDQDRVDDAIGIFKQAVEANDGNLSAHFNLGLAYSLKGDDASAIPEYRRALEIQPGLYEAEINLGQSLLRSGDAAAAIPQLQAASGQQPQDFRPAYFLGEAYLETGALPRAEQAYRDALVIEPESLPAEFGLGRAIARQGRPAEAEPHYRKAAQSGGEYQNFLLELAQAYEDNQQLPEAIAIYREFPDDAAAQERAGVLALRIGQLEQATAALEAAVAADPTPANRLALAQAYLDQEDLAKAEPLAAQVVAADPDNFKLHMFYGRILRDERKFVAAAQQFRIAAGIDPQAGEAWGELAGMLLLAERYPEAIEAYDRLEQLGAALPGHLFFRATAHDRLRDREKAIEYYNRFLEASQGQNPDQEFQARQRVRILELDR